MGEFEEQEIKLNTSVFCLIPFFHFIFLCMRDMLLKCIVLTVLDLPPIIPIQSDN